MSTVVDHISGETFHGRRGAVENAFKYGIDYVMVDAEAERPRAPWIFGRNRAGFLSLWDSDHGGPPKAGRGAPWAREVLKAHGLESVTDGTPDAARSAAHAGACVQSRQLLAGP
jgi:DUF1365 family protein